MRPGLRYQVALLCGMSALAACEPQEWGPDKLGRGHTSKSLRQIQAGQKLYATYCVGCHGEKGDGAGPAARFLDPKPRDFRLGRIKFAAVSSGEVPRDEDYDAVIAHGLSGTAMPSFVLLGQPERAAIISYIRTFIDPANRDTAGAPVAMVKDPWANEPEKGIEEGKRVYHAFAKCWSCHPAYESPTEITRFHTDAKLAPPELRVNLYQSETKESQWGADIRAPDFLLDRVKTGIEVATLAQVINTGIGGTAMPTWAGALPPEQLWGLAHYVRSLALLRDTPEGRAQKAQLAAIKVEVTP